MVVTEREGPALIRRRRLLRDSLAFLSLLAVTLVLFGLTLLLFRSFTDHRDQLSRRWADRGAENLREGRPEQAIVALRTALTYAPDNRGYELLLAQALGEAGRTDESYAYFMTLWEGQPGSGFINYELARLAAKRGDRTAAVEFYRASIYGTWEGDGVVRRANVRLELAHYLIDGKQWDPARMELLIAAGNAPESAQLDETLAGLLSQAKDSADAWTYYQKAVTRAPRDAALTERAGRFAYEKGDFSAAHKMLTRAELVRAEERQPADPTIASLRRDAARITELLPAATLSARDNAMRILSARRIAKKRLDACTAQMASTGPDPALQALSARLAGANGAWDAKALLDPLLQTDALRLVFDTEVAAERLCSRASGDDALLLRAAGVSEPVAPLAGTLAGRGARR